MFLILGARSQSEPSEALTAESYSVGLQALK